MAIAGIEVTLPAMSFGTPPRCCRCEAPSTATFPTHAQVGRATRTVQLPVCAACAARRKSIYAKRRWLMLGAVAFAGAFAAIGVVLPGLPIPLLIAAPPIFAIAAALVLRMNMGDTILTPNGAWMTGWKGAQTSFFCTNLHWGEEFAAANGARVAPKKRSDAFMNTPWVVALIISLPAAWAIALTGNPPVYVDNQGPSSLQFWIDGKKSIVAAPRPGPGARPTVRIPWGSHDLGYSAVGAGQPEATTKARVEWSGEHVYNPGRTTCYWLEAAAYGKASTDGLEQGPQTITEFYTFDRVDNWFKDNPPSVETKASGETRVSVTTMSVCEKMAEAGCSLASRERLVTCTKRAFAVDDEAAYKACIDEAVDGCKDDDGSAKRAR